MSNRDVAEFLLSQGIEGIEGVAFLDAKDQGEPPVQHHLSNLNT